MSNVTTVASHFGVSAAPADETIRLSGQGPQRLVLDILELSGGTSPTIQVILTELIPSVKELQVLSADGKALDSFTPGRVIRGRESGKHVTVTGQRSASNIDYLAYVDSGPSQFFEGETVEERGPFRFGDCRARCSWFFADSIAYRRFGDCRHNGGERRYNC